MPRNKTQADQALWGGGIRAYTDTPTVAIAITMAT
eukprot:CAMPEP_0168454880 /NCGR_PEP_ID=MMETSP0228-20121227/50452_1 /TAXON_ID=133427 /ORGANISM="Protoceratium reticulatum, Strain CCCM 535 (=CCMP 1889)" /LENGTH=34 /DNA_ID= /DNA_START= /DNA_END= /DNA_ORIENTATION=